MGNVVDASNIHRGVHSFNNDLKLAEIECKDVKTH